MAACSCGGLVPHVRRRRAGLRVVLARRLPEAEKGGGRAAATAAACNGHLGGQRMTDREVAGALGVGNAIRYAAATGTVAIRWEGARAPAVWTVAAADVDPAEALPRACPAVPPGLRAGDCRGFARWAGISRRAGAAAFASLAGSLRGGPLAARRRVAAGGRRACLCAPAETTNAPARLLPSGDAYFLLHGAERELLVPVRRATRAAGTPRLAGCAPRRRRDPRHLEARQPDRADRRLGEGVPPGCGTRSRGRRAACLSPVSTARSRSSGRSNRVKLRNAVRASMRLHVRRSPRRRGELENFSSRA